MFHVLGYFADDVRDAFVALGLHPRLSYFAARSAAFGAVGPEVPTATFYVFAPGCSGRRCRRRGRLPARSRCSRPAATRCRS